MSLSWANRIAKSALLSAQKHIDSVLDIQEDDETVEDTTEEDNTVEENISNEEDISSDQISLVGSPIKKVLSRNELQNSSKYINAELSVSTSYSQITSNWSSEYDSQSTPVVESEPNPIRDAHEDAITPLHYSPSSNTPEEEEECGERTQRNNEEITPPPSLTNESSSFDLSLLPNDYHKEQIASNGDSIKSGDNVDHITVDMNPEEVRTIASSDIEIVRNLDDCSISSGNQCHANATTTISDRTSGGGGMNPLVCEVMANSVMMSSVATLSTSTASVTIESQQRDHELLVEQFAILNGKIQHRDQKIEELCKVNDKLKAANANLISKNKQILVKASAEGKLQKQLAEKEKELTELMEEGKRLSEHSGKQSKEIRKLKQQLNQLELITAARDSAMVELQMAQQIILEHSKEMEQLKDNLKDAEATIGQLRTESSLSRASTGIVENFMVEKNAELEAANEELKKLRNELRNVSRAKNDLFDEVKALNAKLLNKRAKDCADDDREKGYYEDLIAERARNSSLCTRICELEQKNEFLMNSQRDLATQIQESNAPLLYNIAALEEKAHKFEKQKDALSAQLRVAAETAARQKRDTDANLRMLAQQLEEQYSLCHLKDVELNKFAVEKNQIQLQLVELEEKVKSLGKENFKALGEANDKLRQMSDELAAKEAEFNCLQSHYGDLLKSEQRMNSSQSPSRQASSSVRPPTSASNVQMLKTEYPEAVSSSGTNESIDISAEPKTEELFVNYKERCENDDDDDDDISNILPNDLEIRTNVSASDRNAMRRRRTTLLFESNPSLAASYIAEEQRRRNSGDDNRSGASQAVVAASGMASAEHLRIELADAHKQLYELRDKFDRLLELYGGCLETIEELKYDNEDLRKLCKEQALQLTGIQ